MPEARCEVCGLVISDCPCGFRKKSAPPAVVKPEPVEAPVGDYQNFEPPAPEPVLFTEPPSDIHQWEAPPLAEPVKTSPENTEALKAAVAKDEASKPVYRPKRKMGRRR